MHFKRMLSLLAIAVLVSGCAGTRFNRVENDDLILGQSTRASVESKLGKPFQKSILTKHGEKVDVITYSYSEAPLFSGNVPVKSQSFFFHKNTLVGHLFTSSWSNESTDFDETKVDSIKKGVTKIEEVHKLFGKPNGEQIYPLTEKENNKASIYYFYKFDRGFIKVEQRQKSLVVIYDPATGIVFDIEMVATNI